MTEPTRRAATEREKPTVPPMRDAAVPAMPGGAVPGGGALVEPTAAEPEIGRPGGELDPAPPTKEAEPSPAAELAGLKRTRISGLWSGIIIAAVVLLLLLVFIVQNNTNVRIYFFGWGGDIPLGVALLAAAVCGLLLVAVPGYGRILQLRRAARRAGHPHKARRR